MHQCPKFLQGKSFFLDNVFGIQKFNSSYYDTLHKDNENKSIDNILGLHDWSMHYKRALKNLELEQWLKLFPNQEV